MYLPTFWKLTAEAGFYRLWHIGGYVVPVGTLGKTINSHQYSHNIHYILSYYLMQLLIGVWVIYPSLYNYYFSCIDPPPRGKSYLELNICY